MNRLTPFPMHRRACPIVGSKSFEEMKHTYSHQVSELLSAKGGYECLDVLTSLENCGGCAATGEGRDCTKIPHVDGVGCGGGQCQIFSCKKGYGPCESILCSSLRSDDRIMEVDMFALIIPWKSSTQWPRMLEKIENTPRKPRTWQGITP